MVTRVFGANKGAGVQVQERQPAAPIQEGPLGSTILLGIFRSGPTDKVLPLPGGLPQYRRVYGGITQDSEAPLAAEHFYELGRGAGQLYALRITDGTEVQADFPIYDRDVDLSILEITPPTKLAGQVGTLSAHNGGRWGGRRNVHAGDVTLGTAITGASVVELGVTMLEDAWKGAILRFPNDDSAFEGIVTGNTALGVVTIAGIFSSSVTGGSDGRWTLELTNAHELTGDLEAMGIEIADGGESPADTFSLFTYRDGVAGKRWENVDLDASGDRYWFDAIDSDLDNYELAVDNDFSGDATVALKRPANFAEIAAPGGVGTNTVTFQVVRWGRSGTGNPYLDTVNDVSWGSDPRPCTITCTFTAATTYTVSVVMEDGQTLAGLPGGTTAVAYAAQHAWLPGWTLRAGATPAVAGTVVTLYVRPLAPDLAGKGAYFYPAAATSEGNVRTKYRVVSNDHETITLASSVDVSSVCTAPGAPEYEGSIAGPFDLSTGALTLILTIGGRAAITLTETMVGAAETAAAVAAHLTAKEVTRAGSAADALVSFSAGTDEKITMTALQDFGPSATIVIGAGTLNAVLGFTGGATASGEAPTIGRLQYQQEFGGGYDGIAGVDADTYVEALDVSTSKLNELAEENTGLLKMGMPGITDADAQAALMTWAYQNNAAAYPEIPDTILTEAAAIAWHEANLAIGAAQDYHAAHFPSYGYIKSPYGAGLYLASLTGAILGIEAAKAVENKGYHLAPAGEGYSLATLVKKLPTGDRRLDQEQLNAYGLIEVRKRGARVFLFGDRIPGQNGRTWLHKRLSMSHIGRVLLTNTGSLVFSAINASTLAEARRLTRELFATWYTTGWFDDTAGASFEKQVDIKADATNNPLTERQLGNLHVDVGFEIVNTAERVVFSIGPKGVSESA